MVNCVCFIHTFETYTYTQDLNILFFMIFIIIIIITNVVIFMWFIYLIYISVRIILAWKQNKKTDRIHQFNNYFNNKYRHTLQFFSLLMIIIIDRKLIKKYVIFLFNIKYK